MSPNINFLPSNHARRTAFRTSMCQRTIGRLSFFFVSPSNQLSKKKILRHQSQTFFRPPSIHCRRGGRRLPSSILSVNTGMHLWSLHGDYWYKSLALNSPSPTHLPIIVLLWPRNGGWDQNSDVSFCLNSQMKLMFFSIFPRCTKQRNCIFSEISSALFCSISGSETLKLLVQIMVELFLLGFTDVIIFLHAANFFFHLLSQHPTLRALRFSHLTSPF